MYISKQLSFKIRDDLAQNIEDVIESTFIEINKTTGKNIIIGLVYRVRWPRRAMTVNTRRFFFTITLVVFFLQNYTRRFFLQNYTRRFFQG